MTDIDTVDERLRAVERAISDGDADDVALTDPDGELTERIETLEANVAELDAAVQAIRGYVGHVRSLDESIEREADSALAAVDDLRERVDRLEADGTTENSLSARSDDSSPDGAVSPGRPRDRRATGRGRTTTDGGTTGQQYETQRSPRRDPYAAPVSNCSCCGSPSNCRPPRAPPREQAGGSGSGRDPLNQGQEPPTDSSPVEDVDEDGLVDRIRGKL